MNKFEEKQYHKPLVSIVIPVYNGSNFMKEAIDSALSQTYENIEVIVVNDGSNDNGETERIAHGYGDKIRYFYKENGGVSSALNLGISKMKGEYFSWLSHDDIYKVDKIKYQVSLAEEDSIVLCGRELIDESGLTINDSRKRHRFNKEFSMNNKEALIELYKQGCFNGCALLIHKSVFNKVGCFNENLRYCQDLLMWTEMFLKGYSLKYTTYCGVGSRVHKGQLTNTGRTLYHKDCKVLADYVLDDICNVSTADMNILYYFAKYNAIYNNVKITKECIRRGRNNNLISILDNLYFNIVCLYGKIRPLVRKLYYCIKRS